jgi:hypothetical protein
MRTQPAENQPMWPAPSFGRHKNPNRMRQARGMNHAKAAGFMPHPNLFHTFADRRQRFAAIGLDAAL